MGFTLSGPARDLEFVPRASSPSEIARAGRGVEYIGAPMIGASVDQFGTQIGGTVSAYFSDLHG